MKFFKKGQTATEYLIILAVVIVIALVVVVAMGRFPGIGSNVGTQGAQAYWSTQDVGVTSLVLNPDGSGSITIKNNLRDAINVEQILIDGNNTDVSTTLNAGGQNQLSFPAIDGINCTSGQDFFVALIIDYTDISTGAEYRITGDGNRYEGRCTGRVD